MSPFYIFAAILGGGLLIIGALSGDGDGVDADAIDADLGGGDAGWKNALSFQALAYALAAFGLTGVALSWVGANPVLTLAAAGVMAAFGATLATTVFGWLGKSQTGFADPADTYVGGIGRAEIRIPPGGRGRIQLVHRGRAFTLPAVCHSGEVERHETVVVVDVVEGVALVERAPPELAD